MHDEHQARHQRGGPAQQQQKQAPAHRRILAGARAGVGRSHRGEGTSGESNGSQVYPLSRCSSRSAIGGAASRAACSPPSWSIVGLGGGGIPLPQQPQPGRPPRRQGRVQRRAAAEAEGRHHAVALLPLRPRAHRLSACRHRAALPEAMGVRGARADGVPARSWSATASTSCATTAACTGSAPTRGSASGRSRSGTPRRLDPRLLARPAVRDLRCRRQGRGAARARRQGAVVEDAARAAASPRRSSSNGVVYFGTEGGDALRACTRRPAA